MKKILLCSIICFGLIACSQDEILPDQVLNNGQENPSLLKKGNPNSQSAYVDYNVNVTVSADGTLWTDTFTKSRANSKNLSHFIIDLQNCGAESATFANVIYSTTNNAPANLTPTDGWGTGCETQETTANFIKINTSAANSWVIEIKFDRGYAGVSSTSWIKAGTSCNTGAVLAPACPIEEYCSFSQGFFFANGARNKV